jgi:hypothetical protein
MSFRPLEVETDGHHSKSCDRGHPLPNVTGILARKGFARKPTNMPHRAKGPAVWGGAKLGVSKHRVAATRGAFIRKSKCIHRGSSSSTGRPRSCTSGHARNDVRRRRQNGVRRRRRRALYPRVRRRPLASHRGYRRHSCWRRRHASRPRHASRRRDLLHHHHRRRRDPHHHRRDPHHGRRRQWPG